MNSVTPFSVDIKAQLEPFTLGNMYLKASFDPNGLLTSIIQENVRETSVAVQFVHYGTRKGQTMSGAYLFLPDGPARVLEPEADSHVRFIDGPIRSQVVVHMPYVEHQVTLHRSPDGVALEIDNLVNIGGQNNFEVAMRLVTNLNTDSAFYSDLNGLQVSRKFQHLHSVRSLSISSLDDAAAKMGSIATASPVLSDAVYGLH